MLTLNGCRGGRISRFKRSEPLELKGFPMKLKN